jgi:hypothetical protein
MTRWYLRTSNIENRLIEYGGQRGRWSEDRGSVDAFWTKAEAIAAKDAHERTCRIEGCEIVIVRVGPAAPKGAEER